MSTLSKVRASVVCGHPVGDIERWIREHGPKLVDNWSDQKLAVWILHHGARRRLAVLSCLSRSGIGGVLTFQRLPDDVPTGDGMAWAWNEDATVGRRLYVSMMVGDGVPLPIWSKLLHDLAVAYRVSSVVCHRRKKVRDLTHLLSRFRHGISQA